MLLQELFFSSTSLTEPKLSLPVARDKISSSVGRSLSFGARRKSQSATSYAPAFVRMPIASAETRASLSTFVGVS